MQSRSNINESQRQLQNVFRIQSIGNADGWTLADQPSNQPARPRILLLPAVQVSITLVRLDLCIVLKGPTRSTDWDVETARLGMSSATRTGLKVV